MTWDCSCRREGNGPGSRIRIRPLRPSDESRHLAAPLRGHLSAPVQLKGHWNPVGTTDKEVQPAVWDDRRLLCRNIVTSDAPDLAEPFRAIIVRGPAEEAERVLARGDCAGRYPGGCGRCGGTGVAHRPVYYRLMFGGPLDASFAERTVDAVLRAYAP